ncbi:hypothetical protein B0H17DRAFT_906168, partial [Mycena rosella]
LRRAWDKEIRGHEATRRAWASEVAAHEMIRVGWEEERLQLVRDREEWLREKHGEETRRKAEDERVRAGFGWESLRAEEHCLRHGARQYSARISNVPRVYDPVQACTETAVEIHGRKIASPSWCEDRGCNGVYGHWTVDYSEPTCVTHFDAFKDKGCISETGLRRIESRLENLQAGDNWRDMCSSTPANFRHLHFESPGMCEHWGKYGVWGIWEIEDREC